MRAPNTALDSNSLRACPGFFYLNVTAQNLVRDVFKAKTHPERDLAVTQCLNLSRLITQSILPLIEATTYRDCAPGFRQIAWDLREMHVHFKEPTCAESWCHPGNFIDERQLLFDRLEQIQDLCLQIKNQKTRKNHLQEAA